jgi:sugar lactone lactonase YvrE
MALVTCVILLISGTLAIGCSKASTPQPFGTAISPAPTLESPGTGVTSTPTSEPSTPTPPPTHPSERILEEPDLPVVPGIRIDHKAQTLKSSLDDPRAIAIDPNGNLYVADSDQGIVVRVPLSALDGTIDYYGNYYGDYYQVVGRVRTSNTRAPFVEGKPATEVVLQYPTGFAFDSNNNLYVVDRNSGRVFKVDARTGRISTVAGSCKYAVVAVEVERIVEGEAPGPVSTPRVDAGERGSCDQFTPLKLSGPATEAILRFPYRIAFDRFDNLYIVDSELRRVLYVSAETGEMFTFAGTGEEGSEGDGGPATEATFDYPRDIAMDSEGNVYVSDSFVRRIRRIDAKTGIISTIAGNGLDEPNYFEGAPAVDNSIGFPYRIAFDAQDNLYIADSKRDRVYRVDSKTNVLTTVFKSDTNRFFDDIVIDDVGNIYLAEASERRVYWISPETKQIAGYIVRGYSDFRQYLPC